MVMRIRPPLSIGYCYKCGRLTILTRKRKALCPKCHADSLHIVRGKYPKYVEGHKHKFTTYTVREQRRKVIRKLKRCQLCGTTENLTVHHIGGSTELGLTCLCRTCHSAYEAWQHRNRVFKT